MIKENRYRPDTIVVKVTKEEKEIIKNNMAQADEKTLTNFVRRAALYGQLITIDFTDLRQFIGEFGKLEVALNRIGNNINQIAKKVNESDEFDIWDFYNYRDEVYLLRDNFQKDYEKLYDKIWSYIKQMEQE